MTTEFFIEIAKLKPGIAFFRDDAFVDDSARTNLQQVFNQFSPTTGIKVISQLECGNLQCYGQSDAG